MKLSLLFVLAFAAACASDPPPASSVPPAPIGSRCALGVSGAHVDVADSHGGVDLTFTTGDSVENLRARAREAAKMHGRGAHAGLGHAGRHGLGDGRGESHGLRLWSMPPAYAQVHDIDNGALLTLVAVDPARRDELRTKVRERVSELQRAPCN